MKKILDDPQHEGYAQEPSEYKSYGDYFILDSGQGNNSHFSEEDDDEPMYLPPIDFTDDQDLEE